jgi:outer membrane biosynthesis protein TonB
MQVGASASPPSSTPESLPAPKPDPPPSLALIPHGEDHDGDPLKAGSSPPKSGIGLGSNPSRGVGGGGKKSMPTIRQGATQVNGRLPPEVIQRVVRQNIGRMRACYENVLATKPDLQGRVAVKFVIDTSGAVASASDGGSDLPEPSVIKCVQNVFASLSFPKPEGSSVTVVYPLVFEPGE